MKFSGLGSTIASLNLPVTNPPPEQTVRGYHLALVAMLDLALGKCKTKNALHKGTEEIDLQDDILSVLCA